MKHNNRGFSLIELIIIMAILAVLGSAIGLGVSLVTGKRVDSCATKLKNAIQNCQTTAMGKYDAYIVLRAENDGIWVDRYILQNASDHSAVPTQMQIGDGSLTVSYTTDQSATPVILSPGSSITIRFDRSSGSFKINSDGATSYYYKEIIITNGNKTATLELAWLTGAVTLR